MAHLHCQSTKASPIQLSLLVVFPLLHLSAIADFEPSTRVTNGLLVLYNFQNTTGRLVKDQSGMGQGLDLIIENPRSIHRGKGWLKVQKPTLIRSPIPATKIIEKVRQTGEITVEAWVQPAKLNQSGPARIVTISRNSSNRNFTLGQDGNKFEVRLRTTKTNNNGQPSLGSLNKSLDLRLTHIVYVRGKAGVAKIFINGKLSSKKQVDGELSNWVTSDRLALADELSKGRSWLGTYHLVAMYQQELSTEEVVQNYRAGIGAQADNSHLVALTPNDKERFFDEEIVPILSKHCLECHDTTVNQGGLDLSTKSTAYTLDWGGEVIIPSRSDESLLWHVVESDLMPNDRLALTEVEKDRLRQWIDQGAVWTTEQIDPLAHTFDRRIRANWVRRLTRPEYIETVRTVTGVDIAQKAGELLPEDVRADGFSNTAYNLTVDLKHIDAYSQLASMIVNQMDVMAFANQYADQIDMTDNVMRKLISEMGRDFLRSDLKDAEVSAFRGLTTKIASMGGTIEEALALVIEAMLLSPRFLYQIENQWGDGNIWPVNGYELATRLSYIILGAPPDQALLNLAESDELFLPQVMDEQIDRLLKDARAVERSMEFVNDWLDLDRLANITPDSKRFPQWNSDLGRDMEAETLAFFKEVAWNQNRPLSDLLNAKVTFATPRLAQHYGLAVSSSSEASKDALVKYNLQSVSERGGLLTQGSLLTIGGDEASMVTRGLFILQNLLRSGVKDPPPCVDTTPVPTKLGLTQRQIAESRVDNPACGGCHGKFEPLAYGLERFDGTGVFHCVDEHGNQLRADGEMFIPGIAKPLAYETSTQLMDLLASSDRVSQALTWKIAQFSLGRPLGQPDALVMEKIHQQAIANGGTYVSVMRAIVKSDLVQQMKTEEEDERESN